MKNNKTLATAVAVSFTLIGSTLCQAQEVTKKQLQFEKLDADKNELLTLEEYTSITNTPERAEHFTRLDSDGSGSLSLQEFSTPPKK